MPIADEPVRDQEAAALFQSLEGLPGFVIAVSGGPDSTALLILASRWAKRIKRPPQLLAVTIDHGLRPRAAAEAAAVKRLAKRLGVPHRTLRWRGNKPASGLQEAARGARYHLLAKAASRAGYAHILTGHTLDDQAETVLFRLARGSGLSGLAGMAAASLLPSDEGDGVFLVRPFLHLPKSRLVATLKMAGVAYSEDPSNHDPRFARVRFRTLMPGLAREGLDARGFARLAARLRRADASIEFTVNAARAALTPGPWSPGASIVFDGERFADLPAEVGLRLLGRAITLAGNEGPVELAKLETLYDGLRQAPGSVRRTLAGALITLAGGRLRVERAPARRATALRKPRNSRFTK